MTYRERVSIEYLTLKVVLAYALVGVIWIWSSDRLLGMVADRIVAEYLQTLKGWLFVLVTAAALYALLRDYLSKRHLMHEVLRHNAEKFSAIFHGVSDSIVLIELDADGRLGHYAEVNEATCHRLGYSRDELLAMSPRDVVQPGSVDVADIMRRLHAEGMTIFEAVQLARDGRAIPVEINSRLVNMGGRKMVLSIARDISERKAAEAKIRNQLDELLRFQKATVGRELRIQELTAELAVLHARLAEHEQGGHR
ncbi:MAG: PAS domain S-box protein [Pseudomonadota bacterium]